MTKKTLDGCKRRVINYCVAHRRTRLLKTPTLFYELRRTHLPESIAFETTRMYDLFQRAGSEAHT